MGAERAIVFPGVTLGMISWRAPDTIAHTLNSYAAAGILDLFAARRIHFNEISPADREIGAAHGFAVSGRPENIGIYGAVAAVVREVKTPYLLSLENDCPLVTDRAGLSAPLTSALADMNTLDVPVFISELRGSYSGVMGLPLFETAALLDAAGVPRWRSAAARGVA